MLGVDSVGFILNLSRNLKKTSHRLKLKLRPSVSTRKAEPNKELYSTNILAKLDTLLLSMLAFDNFNACMLGLSVARVDRNGLAWLLLSIVF